MASGENTVLMIGLGCMGGAIASALAGTHTVLAYDPKAALPDGIERVERLEDGGLPAQLTVLLAIKPQIFNEIGSQLRELSSEGRLFVSIMAGVGLDRLADVFGWQAALIRAMPNTPASIGHGITALVANSTVDKDSKIAATRIFETTGRMVWLEDEADMDVVTAIAGSGPAYFFRFSEALINAGIHAGLSQDVATQLVRQTFSGAARLSESGSQTLAELRQQVTSPQGTTAAGLKALDDGERIDDLAKDVVEAAARRSRELAGKG